MFFNKPNITKSNINNQSVSVLGDGASALYLAGLIQNIGHTVNLICSPSNQRNNIEITFKNPAKLLSEHLKINTSFELIDSPDFLFIASELPDLHADLLLLSPSKLIGSTIINLTPSINPDFISQTLQQQSVSAYLHAQILQKGNTLTLNTQSPQITFNLNTDSNEVLKIQNLFNNNDMGLVFKDCPAENFWNWFAPRVLIYFINNALKTNVKELSKTIDGRKFLDCCINEISLLVSRNKTFLNKNDLLSELYNATTEVFSLKEHTSFYRQRFSSKINMLLFQHILPEDKNFPLLKDLANKVIA